MVTYRYSEAIRTRSVGKPLKPRVQSWLCNYHPLPPVRDQRYHDRKRAELVARVLARKRRVNELMDLRIRALKASARKWPRPPCHEKENQREEKTHTAGKATTERAAADARVAMLLRLRAASENSRRKYY